MTVENARKYVESSDIVIDAVDIRALDIIMNFINRHLFIRSLLLLVMT
jgi:hypothetical protein